MRTVVRSDLKKAPGPSSRSMTRMQSDTPAYGLCATCDAARGVRMRV